jgi:hypothetical protein
MANRFHASARKSATYFSTSLLRSGCKGLREKKHAREISRGDSLHRPEIGFRKVELLSLLSRYFGSEKIIGVLISMS